MAKSAVQARKKRARRLSKEQKKNRHARRFYTSKQKTKS